MSPRRRLDTRKPVLSSTMRFKGMGGNLSFVIAMLDDNNTGFVLNSVHSREGCYLYLKDVVEGKTEVLLGSEEKEALERALGYK